MTTAEPVALHSLALISTAHAEDAVLPRASRALLVAVAATTALRAYNALQHLSFSLSIAPRVWATALPASTAF